MQRRMGGNPEGLFLHDLVLASCRRFPDRIAVVDSGDPPRRVSYAEYGSRVEQIARGLVAAGIQPGEVIAIYLPNCLEFCLAYHAATLAGAVPTPLNPSYREREVRYQLENSGAVLLVTDGPLINDVNLSGLPKLRRIYNTRQNASGTEPFSTLLQPTTSALPQP